MENKKLMLYHVSNGMDENTDRLFIPRIPAYALSHENQTCRLEYAEDDTTERICFADSVQHAMEAAGFASELSEGSLFTVYEAEFEIDDVSLLHPEQLQFGGWYTMLYSIMNTGI